MFANAKLKFYATKWDKTKIHNWDLIAIKISS